MHVTAKADYAVRAAVELATAPSGPITGEAISNAQQIPLPFLEKILAELRQAGIVRSQRGVGGGSELARPAGEVTLGEVIRAVDGPLASVRSEAPEDLSYTGSAVPLRDVWLALRVNLRAVLDTVTLADVVAGELPEEVTRLLRSDAPDDPIV